MRILTIAVATALVGCAAPATAQSPEPFVVKGRAVDENGQPIRRARIVVDNEFLYNSNVTGTTDSNGRYRIALPRVASTWNVTATASITVNGRPLDIDLAPDNPDSLAGNVGGIRNFTARTSGARPGGGSYGGTAIIYTPIGAMYEPTAVQLTFQPVNGGAPVVGQIAYTGDGAALKDIPLGSYRISASRNGRPMELRIRNQGAFSSSVVSSFNQIMSGIFQLELDVR
jgi:hypothetical protein